MPSSQRVPGRGGLDIWAPFAPQMMPAKMKRKLPLATDETADAAGSHPKQPRTLPAGGGGGGGGGPPKPKYHSIAPAADNFTSPASPPRGKDVGHTMTTMTTMTTMSTLSTRSASRKSSRQGGASMDPIDLTTTPDLPSGPPFASDFWVPQEWHSAKPAGERQPADDEHLALTLQAQFDGDASTASSKPIRTASLSQVHSAPSRQHDDNDDVAMFARHNGALSLRHPFRSSASPGPMSRDSVDALVNYAMSIQSTCPSCGRPSSKMTGPAVVDRSKDMLKKQGLLHPCVRCDNRRCGTWFCLGCRERYQRPDRDIASGYLSGKGFKIAWCCDAGRQYLVWSLACGTEYKERSLDKAPSAGGDRVLRSRSKKEETTPVASSSKLSTPLSPAKKNGAGAGPKREPGTAKGVGYGSAFGVHSLSAMRVPHRKSGSSNKLKDEVRVLGRSRILPNEPHG